VIPLTEAIISNSVAARPVSSLFDHGAGVQGGSGSFASTCAAVLSSTTADCTPIPNGADSTPVPKPSKEILPAGGTKTKIKEVQKDNHVATANGVITVNVPTLVAQVTQTVMPAALPPDLPLSSSLKSASAVAGLELGNITNIPLQGPDSLHGTIKQDAVGNVAPQALAAGASASGLAFPFPSLPQPPQSSPQPSPQLHKAEISRAAIANQDAIPVGGGSLTKAPQTSSDPVSVNNNPLPQEIPLQATNSNSIAGNAITMPPAAPSEAVNQLNSINVQTIPAIIRSDSAGAEGRTALSSPGAVPHDAVPQNVAKASDSTGSLAWSGATLGLSAPQQNTKQQNVTAPNVIAPIARSVENPQAGHQPVMAVSPSTSSDPQHSGKANVTSAESVPNAPNKVVSTLNISADVHNGSSLSNSATLDAPSTAANISAILTSPAFALPPANGSNAARTTSIAAKDNHASSSGPFAASPTITTQSIPSNKDSSNSLSQTAGPVHDAAAQPLHRNSIPGAVQPVVAQSGSLQPPVIATSADAGRQLPPSHAAPSGSLPKQASSSLPTSAESAPLMANVSESPAALSIGPVQMAQIVSKAAQSEMRIGLNTSAFGNVEVRTVVHASEVGLVIGSERGDLRSLLGNEIPGIANTLQQQNLRLNEVNFHQGFTFSGNLSSGGDSQPRSFTPSPLPAHSRAEGNTGDNSTEPLVAEASSRRHTGLNILA